VIILTRLTGQPMAINPDLIERAEATPDTVITMVDGHKLVVGDSVSEVVEKVREWRASVAAEAFALSSPLPVARVPRELPSQGGAEPTPAGQVAAGASLARVLRMPAREE
jgi:flagellar protein FlbD